MLNTTGPDLSKDEYGRINNPDIAQVAAERTNQKMQDKKLHESIADGYSNADPEYRLRDSMGGPDRRAGRKEAKKWQRIADHDQKEIDNMDNTVLKETRKATKQKSNEEPDNKKISKIRQFLNRAGK
ncbi:MAG: hypothetical protein Q7S53_01780 [bacterium]|nr:hypothetical protein [bacterium]